MADKYVIISLAKDWVEEQALLGNDPSRVFRFFSCTIDSGTAITLHQSRYKLVFVIKSDQISLQEIKEAVRGHFKVSFLLEDDEFDTVVDLVVTETEPTEFIKIDPTPTPFEEFEESDKFGAFDVLAQSKCVDFDFAVMEAARSCNKSANKITKDVGGMVALERYRSGSMINSKALDDLFAEFMKIAPQIIMNETYDVLLSQAYLFSINEGCGLSTYLKLLSGTLSELKINPRKRGHKINELMLKLPTEEKDQEKIFDDMINKIILDSEFNRFSNIVSIDISLWLFWMKERAFADFMRRLEQYRAKYIFVFRVPFLERESLENVRRVLSDAFTIRTLVFPPFSLEELVQLARRELQKRLFALADDAVSVLTARISEEKSDGKFYGINTVRKIVREMIYLKQLANVEQKTSDRTICANDIIRLAETYDSGNIPGFKQLDALIGLDSLKQRIREIVSQIEVVRKRSNLKMPCIHMRFTGNPGTGKTTVARILGKILNEKGILRNGNFMEYSGRDFCGPYVGQTAPKTAAICRDAYGSVLFIDEAYALFTDDQSSNDYGREALTTLVAEMENHRSDLLVIMAGYTDEMETLMKGNSGLSSRMPYVLEFPNYNRRELVDIFLTMARRDFAIDEAFERAVNDYFEQLPEDVLNAKDFSNARFVRNLYERTWGKAVLREQLNDVNEDLCLKAEDFVQASLEGEFKVIMEKKIRRFGFSPM